MESEGLYQIQPQNAVSERFYKDYEKQINSIWGGLVLLNSNILILERILKFNFQLFGNIDDHFWHLTIQNIYDSSISILYRTVFDEDTRSITLLHLRYSLQTNFKFDEYLKQFNSKLKEINFEKRIKNIRRKIESQRNKEIDHIYKSLVLGSDKEISKLSPILLDELKKAGELVNTFFDAMTFGLYMAKVPAHYFQAPVLDIDKILDTIAEKSPLLRMPEDQPAFWPYYRKNIKDTDIKELNRYRQKFNLTAVPL